MPDSPQKRQRTNSADGDPRTRSEYWFKDGNVVLQAEDTLFRVHQSILSHRSQIFQDTFAVPQPPESQENEHIEGCPVIPLSDTAEDMGNLISLLYDGEKTLNFGSKIPARILGSMLRLGRKYVIPYLENKALESLDHSFPKTLQDYDARRESLVFEPDIEATSQLISIAHEFHLFTILPAAYATYIQQQYLEYLPNDASLPEKARDHCIIGYARILAYIKGRSVDALCPPLVLPSKACAGGDKCKPDRWEIIKNLPVWVIDECRPFGIFEPASATENLCPRCQTEVKKLIDEVRSEFWVVLPILFGLPSWTDLKDEF